VSTTVDGVSTVGVDVSEVDSTAGADDSELPETSCASAPSGEIPKEAINKRDINLGKKVEVFICLDIGIVETY
jgi:hypothetical protein